MEFLFFFVFVFVFVLKFARGKKGAQEQKCIFWLKCFGHKHAAPLVKLFQADRKTTGNEAFGHLRLFSPLAGNRPAGRGNANERKTSNSATDDISKFYSSFIIKKECVSKCTCGASLVAQWLRNRLPTQGT